MNLRIVRGVNTKELIEGIIQARAEHAKNKC